MYCACTMFTKLHDRMNVIKFDMNGGELERERETTAKQTNEL